jgi:hypothetical protein
VPRVIGLETAEIRIFKETTPTAFQIVGEQVPLYTKYLVEGKPTLSVQLTPKPNQCNLQHHFAKNLAGVTGYIDLHPARSGIRLS